MKLTAIFLLTASLTVSAAGHSQRVTLSLKDAPLKTVFFELNRQTGYNFLYNDEALAAAKKVTISVKDAPLGEVLTLCFKDQPLEYAIENNSIVISKRSEKSPGAVILSGVEGQTAQPPPIDITGKVTDADGNPLSGANVKVKGTTQGTTTNADGVFVLKGVDENATLEISFVGYEVYTVAVANKTTILASLKIKPESLNEVVINKGYYTERQITSTSNVVRVTSKEIEKQPVSNPLLALQGRVPGLVVTQTSGFAGSGVKVQVQGQTTLSTSVGTDPLYVVDGVPFPSRALYTLNSIQGSSGTPLVVATLPTGSVSPLSFINPADIESIDVLKDADATAIYGSRAANGAVLITTKKGKAGKTRVGFNLQTGVGKVGHYLDVLNRDQYLQMRHEAFANDGKFPGATDYDLNGAYDTTRATDWQKVLIGGTANYTDLQTNVSGGTTNTQFLVGAGYHKETTVFPGDLADQKGSVHFNINNLSPNQKFRLQFSGSYLLDNNQLMQTDLTAIAVRLSPIAPALHNEDGSLNWAPLANGTSTWINPLSYLYNEYSNKTTNLIGNLVVSYKILKNLEFKSSFGYNDLQSDQYVILPLKALRPERRAASVRSSEFINSNLNSWIIEPNLDYKFSLKKLKVNALIGSTFLDNKNNNKDQSGEGYSSDLLIKDITSAPTQYALSGFSEYKYNAVFGRLLINWDDKYVFNLTTRRDGSSRFGSENLFHNFSSVAGAWIFSKESFFADNLPFIRFGKLRASYGTTGNDQIGDYRFLNLYNPVSGVGVAYQNAVGLAPNGLPNPYLQWEETKKAQFGLDLGFLADKILFNASYYQNRCSNQLLAYSLPIATGFGTITRNFPATIQNTGWELFIKASIVKSSHFTWSSSINLTVPQNKLLEFPGIEQSSYASSYTIGQPVTIVKRYHFSGIDPATGVYVLQTKGGNLTSSPTSNDLTQIINVAPKFFGGFQNSLSYKGFQIDVLFQFVKQTGPTPFVLFGDRPGQFLPDGSGNQPVNVLNRWQKAGEGTSVQRYYATSNSILSTAAGSAGLSDQFFSDASYIRVKNASISWQVPNSLSRTIKIQDAKIYVQGQNLLTITKYRGMDPETLSSQSLPPLRVITMGVQVEL